MAGCPGSSGGGDTSPAEDGPPKPGAGPGYASGMYDPSSVLDASTHGFVSYDLGTLYDHRDLLPSQTVSQIEQYDQRYDAVSLGDLGRLTGQAYTSASVADLRNTSGRQMPPAGGTVLVNGSFESDRIVEMLRQSGSQATVEKVGSEGGYTLYTVKSQSSVPATLALSDDSVGMGAVSRSADASGESAVQTMIDAQGGGSAYYSSSGVVRRLLDAHDGKTTATGVVGNFDPVFADAEFPNESARAVALGLRGVGSGGTLTDEQLTNTMVGVYAEGEAPSEETVQAALEWLRQQSRSPGEMPVSLDEIDVSVDGRTVTATISRDPEELIPESGEFESGFGITALVLTLLFPGAAAVVFGYG